MCVVASPLLSHAPLRDRVSGVEGARKEGEEVKTSVRVGMATKWAETTRVRRSLEAKAPEIRTTTLQATTVE